MRQQTANASGTPVALMFGGDLGDSAAIFAAAAAELERAGMTEMRRSRIIRSAPVDCVPGTPDFSDQALTGLWHGSAWELLAVCQKLERAAGRPARHSSCEARTLDIDIILFGNEISDAPELIIPHPRARKRRFVLEPLAEIAPDWRFPDTGTTILEEFDRLPN
ncbi:MAG: 2-amino-4-hydroxy-6-hydroxymethyldihydropteridine diphosphokinase [Lentisphaeria bacterium]|nr:2-amino-4-hydroxy-6-hydroxymethyldihydropteridine diphosphokinase [Lentisphaeria bacterium]